MTDTEMAGRIGMEEPMVEDHRERWAVAAPLMAMAFCEAGYPTTYHEQSPVWTDREHELTFGDRFPPDDVLIKAARLTGVEDIMRQWIDVGRPAHGEATGVTRGRRPKGEMRS